MVLVYNRTVSLPGIGGGVVGDVGSVGGAVGGSVQVIITSAKIIQLKE